MRVPTLSLALILIATSSAVAFPTNPLPHFSPVIQVHGCHQHYAQDQSGWHRHDKHCQKLRNIVKPQRKPPERS